ncbi:hypothetical protein G7072_16890 [Nocardioides sp. HDW12B]|uniref:hypothetical protein n=1 Tax=Nocardioides sp. HDW12B TaxID=2714939 RepID=UPI00140D9FA1|nr:hypothetical protein [Nocardioides sp. HDW12B]QIK67799.1 hypothetical protein G7072_16890 [Nocardioides sp. HDW12B]
MSDLFTSLRQEDPAVGLPADEVRRLGDRARRRRTAVRAAGATCVVAAVGAASLAVGTGTPRTAPDPAAPDPGPSPTRAVAPEPDRLVPDGFPLSRGLPMSAGTPDLAGPEVAPFSEVVPSVCGTTYALAGSPVDRLAMEGTNVVFQGVRDLAVYAEPGQALRAVEEQAQRLRDCPTERGAGSVATTTVEPLDVGDRAWRATRVYTSGGTAMSVEISYLVQRGTAALVLKESLFDEPAPVANGPAIDVETELGSYLAEQERTVVAPLTEALCRVETVCD